MHLPVDDSTLTIYESRIALSANLPLDDSCSEHGVSVLSLETCVTSID